MVDLSKFRNCWKAIVISTLVLGLLAGCSSSKDSSDPDTTTVACANVSKLLWSLKDDKNAFEAGTLDANLYVSRLKETIRQLTFQRDEASGLEAKTIDKIASELNLLPIDKDWKLKIMSYAKVNEGIEELNSVCKFSSNPTPTPTPTSTPSPEIQNQENLKQKIN
jgi:hypothetical protein